MIRSVNDTTRPQKVAERVTAYIDGFNLYYGLRAKGWRRYLWLDLFAFAESLVRPDQVLTGVTYCTARISGPPDSVRRQTTYLDALQVRGGIRIVEGKFLRKDDGRCKRCGNSWPVYEEKQTDVNLAVEMLRDAHLDMFDVAMLVSGDSDLAPAVVAVRELHAAKRVVIANPPARRSDVLARSANGSFPIGRKKLADCQLASSIVTRGGHQLIRPPKWT